MEYKNKQKNIFAIIVFLLFLISPVLDISGTINKANAQGNVGKTYTLLEPLPCLTGNEFSCSDGTIKQLDLGNFFQYVINLLIGLAAVAAVFMIVYGGFEYMTTDAWDKKSAGLEKFKNAIYGLLLVLLAFLILRTVNPKLVAIQSSIPAIQVPASQLESPLSVYDRMAADAAQFGANIQTVKAAIVSDQEQIVNANKQIQDIESQIDLATSYSSFLNKDELCGQATIDDANVRNLCNQRSQLQATINLTNQDIALQTMKGVADSLNYQCSHLGDPGNCTVKSAYVAHAYNVYSGSLNPDQIKVAHDYLLYNQADIEITRQEALMNQNKSQYIRNEALTSIDNAINKYKTQNSNNDANLLSKLMTHRAKILEDISA